MAPRERGHRSWSAPARLPLDVTAGPDRREHPAPRRLAEIRSATVEQAVTTIGERVNATGVVEPTIQRQGTDENPGPAPRHR